MQLLEAHDRDMAVATTLSTLAATRQLLHETGVQELVYEDFYAELVALVEGVVKPDPQTGIVLTSDELLRIFRDPQGESLHTYPETDTHTLQVLY